MKKNKFVNYLLISIFAIIIILICMDYFIVLNPKNNVKKLFSSFFDLTNKYIERNLSNDTKSIKENGSLTLSTNLENYTSLDGYNFIYNLEYDQKNNTAYLDLKINENIESKFYYVENNLYIDFPYIIPNIVKVSTSDNDIIDFNSLKELIKVNINKDDLTYLNDLVRNSIINNINNENIDNEMNGFKIKYTYEISISDLLGNIIDEILENDKSLNIIKYSKEEISSFKNNLSNENIKFIFNTNLLGEIKDISVIFNNKKIDISIDSENNIYNVSYNINNDSNSISSNFIIELYAEFYNIDGNIKFNMKEDKYVNLNISNVSSINDELTKIEIKDSKSLSELSDNDLNNIKEIINNFK